MKKITPQVELSPGHFELLKKNRRFRERLGKAVNKAAEEAAQKECEKISPAKTAILDSQLQFYYDPTRGESFVYHMTIDRESAEHIMKDEIELGRLAKKISDAFIAGFTKEAGKRFSG